MHKDCIRFCQCHHIAVDGIAGKCFLTYFFFCFLTHTCPGIGVNNVHTCNGFFWIVHNGNAAAGFCCILLCLCNDFRIWHIAFRTCNGYVHTNFSAANHQRMSHVIAVTNICKFDSFQMTFVFLNGNQVCNYLCWMIIICQAVDYRNICVFCQFFYFCMAVSTNHNTIHITG